jgi:rhodanese-related sulfurtransferase
MTRPLSLLLTFVTVLIYQASAQNAPNSYKEISLPQLMEILKQGDKNAVVVDVRTPGEYYDTLSSAKHLNIGRIKGAVNLDLQSLQKNPENIKQLDEYKDKNLYVICSHSYRSRTVSNLLLKNGFSHVNNVQGGMSEWFRLYEDLKPYRASMYESHISYQNLSPAQLYAQLGKQSETVFIGFTRTPRNSFDSMSATFYKYFPDFKNATYFGMEDSAKVLEFAKSVNGKPIVTFNLIGFGAAENAEWLTKNNIPNVTYLVSNLYGFYEYVMNKNEKENLAKVFKVKSPIRFITSQNLCGYLDSKKDVKIIDIRHDTLFNKLTDGTKHNYKHLKGSLSFPSEQGASAFEQKFPDKKPVYVVVAQGGVVGIEMAEELVRKGYKIEWLMGGLQRWEWYVNNVGSFSCKNYFVQ